jgi:hypothetical protein
MCTASFMMVALACILTTRPEGNWRIFRLQVHGFHVSTFVGRHRCTALAAG